MNKISLISIFVLLCAMPFLLGTESVYAYNSLENDFSDSSLYPQQDVEKETNDEGSENNLGYVFAVFAIVWGLFFAFMILLMRKQTRINSEISYLKQLLENKKTPE